jgi:hypothetical protein
MQRIIVTDEIAKKLERFPKQVHICDDEGNTALIFERAVEPSDVMSPELSVDEMLQTLHEVF